MRQAKRSRGVSALAGRLARGGVLWVLLPSGCAAASRSQAWPDLEARDPLRRAQAVIAVAQTGDPALAALLVDRLEDEDAVVRMLAAEGLARLTGQSFEYDPAGPEGPRAQAADTWRRRLSAASAANHEQSHHID